MMERLFVYGSLQPGGPNEHVLSDLPGTWEQAALRGRLYQSGWGAEIGFPGVVLDDASAEVDGFVFTSDDLCSKWKALDEFEGDEYERVLADVSLSSGCQVQAHVYVLKR